MTSRYETDVNLEDGPTRPQQRPAPVSSEAAYARLTCYGFARRYVGGKTVADIGWEELGHGSRLLAETAESVAGLTDLPEAVDLASTVYSAPNVSYRRADLPTLPYPEDHFDVVVAFGVVDNLDDPEELVREARRVLKEGGVLVLSALDKQIDANDRNGAGINSRRGIYVPEFWELLKRHFGHAHLYRQGVVAGGFVFPVSEEVTAAPVESARFSLTDPHFGLKPPMSRSVIAVCSDARAPAQQEEPYLLLDRDRRVFDECEERAEDVELLTDEIRQMQQTEVQAFLDTIKAQRQQNLAELQMRYLYHLRSYLVHRRNIIHGNIRAVRRKGAIGSAKGALRRSRAFYQHSVIFENLRHRRNVVLENVHHRRNIVLGNVQAIRRKGAIGSAKGALRRSYALYLRLRAENKNLD